MSTLRIRNAIALLGLLAAVLLALPGCGGHSALSPAAGGFDPAVAVDNAATGQPGPGQALPALPPPSALRKVSGQLIRNISGANYSIRSTGAALAGADNAMLLDATASKYEWTMYSGFVGTAKLNNLLIINDPQLPDTPFWVGYANFATSRWDWNGPYQGTGGVALPDPGCISPSGVLNVVVLAPQGSKIKLDLVQFYLEGSGVEATLTADPPYGEVPLPVYFDASASLAYDSPATHYAWDWDNDGMTDYDSGNIPHLSHTYDQPGNYTCSVRVIDGNQVTGTASVDVSATLFGTVPPSASFTMDKDTIQPGDTVHFDASASHDPDGTIVQYVWDIYADTYSEHYATDKPTFDETFNSFDHYKVQLRVIDNDGGQGEAAGLLQCHGWRKFPVDDAGDVGEYNSLCVIDGRPAISYYDKTNGALKYAISTTPGGVTNWNCMQVDNGGAGDAGSETSLALINGRPEIAYVNTSSGELHIASSVTPGGDSAADWSNTGLGAAAVGAMPSLQQIDGKPAMAFESSADFGSLIYGHADSAHGTLPADWHYVTVDSSFNGWYPCLKEINSHPAIAYFNFGQGSLCYASAGTASGSAIGDWQHWTIDDGGSAGWYPSLVDIAGCPAIAYYNATYQSLHYIRSNSAVGGSAAQWIKTVLVDDGGGNGTGTWCAMAEVGGHPVISYQDDTLQDLHVAESTTLIGDSPALWQKQLVDGPGSKGANSSIAEVQQCPAISYYDATNGALMYAIEY